LSSESVHESASSFHARQLRCFITVILDVEVVDLDRLLRSADVDSFPIGVQMVSIAMIPARMGSQRLKQKNLVPLRGDPLIVHAILKCRESGLFDSVWVNSEHSAFGEIAEKEGVHFHPRPAELATNNATSEQFVAEFLEHHPCDFLFQVHSIAPLLTSSELRVFVETMKTNEYDVLLSVVDEPLEALCRGEPVNFTFEEKTNSQDLEPVRRISWSVTAWRRETFLAAARDGQCATYAGRVGLVSISRLAGLAIKTAEDFAIAEALYDIAHASVT
jgi:CMP-N-acetylneuraminic acid synthetase